MKHNDVFAYQQQLFDYVLFPGIFFLVIGIARLQQEAKNRDHAAKVRLSILELERFDAAVAAAEITQLRGLR